MVDVYDFDFAPDSPICTFLKIFWIRDYLYENPPEDEKEDEQVQWRSFTDGGYMDVDTDELVGFDEDGDWDLLDDDFDEANFVLDDDEVWMSN
jgi:hypothetical protein